MQVVTGGSDPKLGIFSGIHGNEWGIISSVKKALEEHKTQLPSFIFIPECSPSAVEQKTRQNGEGIDLNRSFVKNPQSKEAQALISLLNPYTFELCIDFHEDLELLGIYVYDSKNIEGSDGLASFRQQVKIIAPLYSGADDNNDNQLGGIAHEGYRASLPPQKDAKGNYIYEGFFDYWALIEGKTKRWLTLEVPTNLSKSQKDNVVDIFFRTLILNNVSD